MNTNLSIAYKRKHTHLVKRYKCFICIYKDYTGKYYVQDQDCFHLVEVKSPDEMANVVDNILERGVTR